ncbi:MFS transporter [Mesorhizobium sp.]|uniref:MFS transporter n=1 Tax=Mesorhizobium sp. TaxID=1871066 RepID=UPI0011F5330F|nr:MFS transporter [Mesorhizobium sp.]TIS54225.1 MAG: MFS transporter [Mesorhizobium sp.]TIS88575.1 MAG: MFS transporter [Mesorhizobium sp.]
MTMTAPSVPNKTAVLAIVLTSYLMIVLDISIAITGLPKIRKDLAFSATGLSWVQTAYMLSFGGLLMLGARAGDVFGRRRMFLIGLGLFTAASLAIGLAQMPAWLLAARAVQGVGAAILAPTVLALLSTNFPEGAARTRALAYYSMVAGVGSSLGLVLGGLFADWISWRVGFFMNVPIGIALMLAARSILRETERRSGAFDVVGAVSSTLGMTMLVYGMVRSAEAGWSDALTLSAVAAGLFFLAVFVVNERRVPQPILPLWLFASRERSGAYVARMLFVGSVMGFFFFTTQLMQGVLGYTPLQAGLGFLPMTVPTFAAAVGVPSFTRHLGNGGLLTLALAFLAAGMLWLGRADAETGYLAGIALPMILIGFGNGFALGPLTVAGVAGVADKDAGAASGLVNVAHQLGGSLGLAILVVVFAAARTGAIEGRELLAHQIATAITGGGVMLVLALVLVFTLIVRPHMAVRPPIASTIQD